MEFPLIVLFGVVVVGLALSMHIGAAIGMAVLAAIFVADLPFALFAQKMYTVFDSFPLLALPFFICVGTILQRGSLAKDLLNVAQTLVGHKTGGLAQVSILTCLLDASLSGSPPATTAAVGGIMIPAMKKEHYPAGFATAVSTAGGTLGALIPPSNPLIIFGAAAGVSISDLFIAVIGPGIITACAFMLLCYWYSWRYNYGEKDRRYSWKERFQAIYQAKWALLVPCIVLGGIYSGIATPTEAGAVAVVYALFAETFITKKMTREIICDILVSTARTVGMMFFVITSAAALGVILVYYNADSIIGSFLTSFSSSKPVLIFIVVTILIILGTFMEPVAMILIMTPIFMPIMLECGMDPIQFGLVMGYGVVLGNITPPVGMSLYVGCAVGKITFAEISKAILPFVLTMIAVFYLIAYVPVISLCLL